MQRSRWALHATPIRSCTAHTHLLTHPPTCALPADNYQPYLGLSSSGACQVCSPTANPRYTSNAGDDYCTIPWVDTVCTDGESRTEGLVLQLGVTGGQGWGLLLLPAPPGH